MQCIKDVLLLLTYVSVTTDDVVPRATPNQHDVQHIVGMSVRYCTLL